MLRGFAGLSWNDRASASATLGCGAWVQSDLALLWQNVRDGVTFGIPKSANR